MENQYNNLFSLSAKAKREYLNTAINKTYKILHLIEEEKLTNFSPRPFITGFLFELNAANDLFEGRLVQIIVKLKGVRDEYKNMKFNQVKSQIFEVKKIINSLLSELEE